MTQVAPHNSHNMAKNFALVICIIAIFLAAFVIWPWLDSRAEHNCIAINENRREAENRATILRRFLLDAAKAREATAKIEAKTNLEKAAIDFAAASRYRDLAQEIHSLPLRDC